MDLTLTQTAEHTMHAISTDVLMTCLPDTILEQADLHYSCNSPDEKTLLLRPAAFSGPIFQRNSFIPEIRIAISRDGGEMTLRMSGRPLKIVRYFLYLWVGILLLYGLISLFSSNSPAFILSPFAAALFGYLLSFFVTKFTFNSVVKAIRRGLY